MFAILYALLVLALVGTAAVVVDLAMLRESRASTRSAADSAVLVAAASLNAVQPSLDNPSEACRRAWQYLVESLGGPGPNQLQDGRASCSIFPSPPVVTPCPTAPITATSTGVGWTVHVTWPVHNGSLLMREPDLAPASVTQPADPTFDGTDPCARIGLEIFKTNAPFFAGVFGAGAVKTRAASVARGTGQVGDRDVIAALNILEPTRCEALTTNERGSILVDGAGGDAGIIAVESNGRGAGSTCRGNRFVIHPRNTRDNTIRASGPGGVGDGLIQAHALNPEPTGNPAKAYTSASRLFPTPSILADTGGIKPVTDLFNCTLGSCAPGGGPWINELQNKYAGSGPPTLRYSGAQSPYSTTAFNTLPGAAVPTFACNQAATTVVPAGNWFINCSDGLNVSTTLIFQGGVIVTAGAINVASGGCLAVNVPATTCPSVNNAAFPVTTDPAPIGDAILYVRAGRLFKEARSALYLPRTFTYLGDGSTDLGGDTGTLLWTTPLAIDCAARAECSNKRFKRLLLWSEKNQPHSISGQASLTLHGALVTPNAASTFVAASTGQNQTAAQFWTRTLAVDGRGTLAMSPTEDGAVARPLLPLVTVSLIR